MRVRLAKSLAHEASCSAHSISRSLQIQALSLSSTLRSQLLKRVKKECSLHMGLSPCRLSLSTYSLDRPSNGLWRLHVILVGVEDESPERSDAVDERGGFLQTVGRGWRISRSPSCPHWMGKGALTNASLTEWIPEAT